MNPQEQEVVLVELNKKFNSNPSQFDKWQTSALKELTVSFEKYGKLTEKMVEKVLLRIYNQQYPKNNTSKLIATRVPAKSNDIISFKETDTFKHWYPLLSKFVEDVEKEGSSDYTKMQLEGLVSGSLAVLNEMNEEIKQLRSVI